MLVKVGYGGDDVDGRAFVKGYVGVWALALFLEGYAGCAWYVFTIVFSRTAEDTAQSTTE